MLNSLRDSVNSALSTTPLGNTNVSPALCNAIELHPLILFVKGKAQTREGLISHPQVESLLFISNHSLFEMFYPLIAHKCNHTGTWTTKLEALWVHPFKTPLTSVFSPLKLSNFLLPFGPKETLTFTTLEKSFLEKNSKQILS